MYSNTFRYQDVMVGDEAQAARSFLEIVYPMECGKIKHWEEMDLLWDYSFKKLQLDPPNTKILLTEPPMNPLQNRQRMLQVSRIVRIFSIFLSIKSSLKFYLIIQIMFEKYGFYGCHCETQAVLTLYSQGVSCVTAFLFNHEG